MLTAGGCAPIPGAVVGRRIIGVDEKLFRFWAGSMMGGATEYLLAYIPALLFLVFRLQAPFGERIIERV